MENDLLKYFISDTKDKLQDLRQDVKEINTKVDTILKFKYQIIGGAALVSVIITLFFQVFTTFFK